ncbi:MAG TPA: hypothetical protein VMF61_03660 [Candidatus Acidoferrales bacterium]|nr:hypothetical protein [Candidatus Acidoferrales bacterium]
MAWSRPWAVALLLGSSLLWAGCGTVPLPASSPVFSSAQELLRAGLAGTKIASLAWGAVPHATAGTAFPAAGKPLTVVAENAAGKKIVGSYASPISVKDSDASGATSLTIDGKSSSGGLTSSSEKLELHYTGLAVGPVTLTISARGAKAKQTTFVPELSAIVYSGPTASPAPHPPEIDLYSNVPGTSGFSGSFTATQAGWTAAAFDRAFRYAFAGIAGKSDDCPGGSHPAFAVTPASGKPGTGFTVAASTALQHASNPAPYAGECAMILTGGGSETLTIVLTYTTSSVGIGAQNGYTGRKRAHKR